MTNDEDEHEALPPHAHCVACPHQDVNWKAVMRFLGSRELYESVPAARYDFGNGHHLIRRATAAWNSTYQAERRMGQAGGLRTVTLAVTWARRAGEVDMVVFDGAKTDREKDVMGPPGEGVIP